MKFFLHTALFASALTPVFQAQGITFDPQAVRHKTVVYKRPFDQNNRPFKGCRIHYQTLRSHITPTNTTEHHSTIANTKQCCQAVCGGIHLWDRALQKRNVRNGPHLRDTFYEDRCACIQSAPGIQPPAGVQNTGTEVEPPSGIQNTDDVKRLINP